MADRARSIWVVDDDRSIRWVLERALMQDGLEPVSFESGDELLARLRRESPDAVIADIRMPGIGGLELLEQLRETDRSLPVIIMTAHSDLDSAVSSYQGGAFDYLPKPFDVDEALAMVHRALEHADEGRLEAAQAPEQPLPEILGQAPAMQEVFRAIGRLSQSSVTVLIIGESGTGKELVARALHRHSPRAGAPFIALNMAAMPRELVEAELFGHEKGAFTGANQQRSGRFEQAHGGTLFLDEIGDMPPETQTRLLRVLADGEFYRLGGHTPLRVDVRVIAATHQQLERLVREGRFREDLYHRLNVIRLQLPRLAERRSDVPLLARHFLLAAAKELDCEAKILHPAAEAYLSELDWPGNVRQLENTCRWLTVMAPGREIHVEDLPTELEAGRGSTEGDSDWETALARWLRQRLAGHGNAPAQPLIDVALPRLERVLIRGALHHTGGRRRDAARLLGWGRNTLTRKIKELGIETASADDAAQE